jgi:hypothetical protein
MQAPRFTARRLQPRGYQPLANVAADGGNVRAFALSIKKPNAWPRRYLDIVPARKEDVGHLRLSDNDT